MRWRRTQGFELPEDEREGVGPDAAVMRGDELPLVSSPQPHLSSSASSSLSSTQLSTLEDSSTSTSNSKMDAPRTVSLTALSNSSSPVVVRASTPKDSPGHRSQAASPTRHSVPSGVPSGVLSGIVQVPSRVEQRPPSGGCSVVRVEAPDRTSTTITLPSSPHHYPSNGINTFAINPIIAQIVPVNSPQRDAPLVSQSIPVSPVRVAVSPTKSPPAVNGGHKVPVMSPAKPPSGAAQRTSSDGGGVVVVVKSASPHTTTVPVGQQETGPGQGQGQGQGRKGSRSNSTAGQPSVRSGIGDGKRATHEKSKSVTIVVNDQHVSYSSPATTPHHNGALNGNVVMPGLHRTDTDASRPSSAASFQTSTKVDPDIQVRPLVGWASGGGEGSSVVEDAASSDDCHRSTLTLVHTPARTYLTGDGEGHCGGAAWGGGMTSLCSIAMVLGAALWLRLPRLLYQYGAGSFLAAWAGVMVIVAAPLSYLEASLAQFSSSAALALWRLVPIARGVGWSTVVVCLYWAVVVLGYLAPLLHYLIFALHPPTLQGEGGADCPLPQGNYNNTGDWLLDHHSRCVYDLPDDWNAKLDLTFSWPLLACTAAATLLAALTGMCGPRTIATVTTTTSVFAIIGLILQLSLGLACVLGKDVEVMWDTARPFLIPQLHTLLQPGVWCAAVGQVLLSLGLGAGVLMSFSSHASFRFPLRRHLCGLMSVVMLVTLLVAAVVVIQLTLLATDRHLPLHHALAPPGSGQLGDEEAGVVGVNVGTAVITASHLITTLVYPVSWLEQVVSFFVYVGLWSSGVTTCVACVHTLVVALRDTWECLPRPVAALLLAPFLMALALPTTTRAGGGAVSLVDEEVLSLALLWPPVTLTFAITAIYGIHKVRKDFTFMLEAAVSWVWSPVWGVLLPLLLLGVLVWLCVMDGAALAVLGGPGWKIGVVWGLRAAVILPVPITAIYVIQSQLAYGVVDKVASSLQSSREWGDWGPQDPIEHHNWRRWREDETRPITSLKRRLATRPLTYTHSTLSSESSSTLTRLRSKYQRNGGPPSLL